MMTIGFGFSNNYVKLFKTMRTNSSSSMRLPCSLIVKKGSLIVWLLYFQTPPTAIACITSKLTFTKNSNIHSSNQHSGKLHERYLRRSSTKRYRRWKKFCVAVEILKGIFGIIET